MRTFATYIEYLLMTRHYCYVPGRGAYMLAEESARITMPTQAPVSATLTPGADADPVISAPHRVVRFSALHYHDDGLLANLLMEAEGMTYDEATRYIRRQAPLLDDTFLANAALHTDIEHFGLADIHVATWAQIERRRALAAAPAVPVAEASATTPHITTDAEHIVIPKYWLRRAAAVAFIIVCFFANFLGLNDRVPQEQLAAVLDVTMFQRSTLTTPAFDYDDLNEDLLADALDTDGLTDEAALLDAELLAFEAPVDADETPVPEVSTSVHAPAPSANTSLDPTRWNESLPMRHMDSQLAMAQSPTGRLYYIIIASCPSEADAQRALGNLHNAGYDNVGILERDGRFRLYVNFFAIKTEAEAYISQLRQIERFHDAWMLPVRDGSLSHIIKNTYNDNQLSMELSHLNQRTERDQG